MTAWNAPSRIPYRRLRAPRSLKFSGRSGMEWEEEDLLVLLSVKIIPPLIGTDKSSFADGRQALQPRGSLPFVGPTGGRSTPTFEAYGDAALGSELFNLVQGLF